MLKYGHKIVREISLTKDKTMKNIYLASVNPMYFSHLNTFLEAQRELGEMVYFCICHNPTKNTGVFSLEERVDIAHRFYAIPTEQIVILKNKDDIISAIRSSQVIVRGIRSEADMIEIRKLIEHFGVTEDFGKGLLITVPENMKQISSSRLVEKIRNGDYKLDDNWVPPKLVQIIKDKLKI